MERKMFGHRMKKRSPEIGRDPGLPPNYNAGRRGDDHEEKAEDNPHNYEGREHVKYRNPGYSKHDIRYPQDEPHMKSHVSRDEEHEMEDDYHMDMPDQTEHKLPAHIKRAHMLMDSPNQENPKPLRGNLVHNTPYEGEEDETGEEEMGPHDMQSDEHEHEHMMPKEHRKKMIAAVVKRKMMRRGSEDGRNESEGKEEVKNKKKFGATRSSY